MQYLSQVTEGSAEKGDADEKRRELVNAIENAKRRASKLFELYEERLADKGKFQGGCLHRATGRALMTMAGVRWSPREFLLRCAGPRRNRYLTCASAMHIIVHAGRYV